MVAETLEPLEIKLPRLAEDGVGAVRFSRAAIEGAAEPELVLRHEMESWQEPFPSAKELSRGGLGRSIRLEFPTASPRDITPRRQVPRRNPRAGDQGPTLFGPDA